MSFISVRESFLFFKSRGNSWQLNFPGGFPDDQSIAKRTLHRFNYPFRGCLQDVFVNSDGSTGAGEHLVLAKLEGQNIGICDLEDNFV